MRGHDAETPGRRTTTFIVGSRSSRPRGPRLYSSFYLLVHDLGPVAFFGLVAISSMLAVGEFYRLHVGQAPWPWWGWVGVAATGLLLSSAQWPSLVPDRAVLLSTVVVALCLPLLSKQPLRNAFMDGLVLAMGVLYIGLTLSYLLLIRGLPDGALLIFFVVVVTWAGIPAPISPERLWVGMRSRR